MIKAGQMTPVRPVVPDITICDLRNNLIAEETQELRDAFIREDLVQVADALGDLLYVSLGGAVACGIDVVPVFPNGAHFQRPVEIKMSEYQDILRAWLTANGAVLPLHPKIPEMGQCVLAYSQLDGLNNQLRDAFMSLNRNTIAQALHALVCGVLVVACQCGVELEPVFAEIHRSNESKFIDGHRRADGKWLKGPSYTAPSLYPILLEQTKAACVPA